MSKAVITEAEAKYRALDLLDTVEQQEFEEQQGAGTGTDRRFESPDCSGFELMHNMHLIHMAVFRQAREKKA